MKKENLFEPDCIRTFTGKYINVFEPTQEMIDIVDIAHGLSNQCRFAGHMKEFYSVAQHSWHCYSLADDNNKISALLHDASEAYLCDIPKPIKKHLPDYQRLEENLMNVISEKFCFEYPISKEVKEIDQEMLCFEWDNMIINTTFFECWNQYKSKKRFLDAFERVKKCVIHQETRKD